MNRRRNHNFILILTTLSLYLGLMVFNSPVVAQEKSEAERSVPINKRPLVDFSKDFIGKFKTKEFDLATPFSLKMEFALTKDGKLDQANIRVVNSSGDPKMIRVTKDAVAAVSDSGYFAYLTDLKLRSFALEIVQDNKSFSVILASEAPTIERARSVASAFNSFVVIGTSLARSDDEKLLMNNLSGASTGVHFSITFTLPQKTFEEFLLREIQKAEAEKTQSNG